jgi:hypothetical protein
MREGCKSLGASKARDSDAGERRRGGFPTGVDRRGEGGESDRWGLVDKETRERRPTREGVIRKGKRISREDATDALAGWAGRAISACGDGAAGGLAGPEAKPAAGSAGPKARKRISELKIRFLNLPRLWKFIEGDLGGILT